MDNLSSERATIKMLFPRNNREPVSIEESLPPRLGGGRLDARRYASDQVRPSATYPTDDREVWDALERAAFAGRTVNERDCFGRRGWLVVQWQVPEALELMRSIYKHERSFNPIQALCDALVVSGRGDSFEASTVMQFMRDHFGGTKILETVQSALQVQGQPRECSGVARAVRATKQSFIVNFNAQVDPRERRNFSEAVRWLAKAVRPNLAAQHQPSQMPDSKWLRQCRSMNPKPMAEAVMAEIDRRESIYVDIAPRLSESIERVLSESMDVQLSSLNTKPLNVSNANCWQRLFRSAFVADFEIQHPAGMKGLKVDFNMMCELAGVENITRFANQATKRETYFPVGYFTALGPVGMSGNRIQWHLYESKTWSHGDDLGFTRNQHVDLSRRHIKGLMKRKFECYLGWANDVEVLLGTEALDARKIGWSGLREKRRQQEVTGTSFSLNFSFKLGINFGGGVSRTYRTVSTLQRFDNKDANFAKAIPHGCIGNAVVYDSTTQRGWLVPKLSLLLHLMHFYYYQFQSMNDNKPSPVPFALPDYDGGAAAAAALKNKGNVVLFQFGEEDEDKRALRNVLLDLNLNLANSPLVGQKVGRRYLYASELAGMATEPDAGLPYTEVSKPAWAVLVQFFDAIGVCSQLGPAIRPNTRGQSNQNCRCDDLVPGRQVLGASMICIRELIKRRGFSLPQLLEREVQIAQDVWWRYNPFIPCYHRESFWDTAAGKAEMDNYQLLTRIKREYGKLTTDQRQRLFSLKLGGRPELNGQPSERGAVVFGKEDGWFVKMADKIGGMSSRQTQNNNVSGPSTNSLQPPARMNGGGPRRTNMGPSTSSQNLPFRMSEGDPRRANMGPPMSSQDLSIRMGEAGPREASSSVSSLSLPNRQRDPRAAVSREGSLTSGYPSERRYDPRLESRGSTSSQNLPLGNRTEVPARFGPRELAPGPQIMTGQGPDRGRIAMRDATAQKDHRQRDSSRSRSRDDSIRSTSSISSYQTASSQVPTFDASRRVMQIPPQDRRDAEVDQPGPSAPREPQSQRSWRWF